MRIGILCAGDDEVAPFLERIKNKICIEKSMLRFYRGEIESADVVTLYSGVGKVNAAIAAQNLIDYFHCDMILHAGTAGGISHSIALFDTVIIKIDHLDFFQRLCGAERNPNDEDAFVF